MDNQRHQIILNELDKKGNVTVASLVELQERVNQVYEEI